MLHRGSACSGRWTLWTEQALMGSRTLIMAPEKHPTRGKDRDSQCRTWWCRVGIHVYLFMSVTSFASLVIFRVPHIKKIARQLNRVLIGAIFCPLSLLQVIFGITLTCYHDALMPLPTLIVLLNDRYWMCFLIFLIFVKSLILFGPAFIVFSQSRGKTIKPGFQKRKLLWSARTHLVDLAGSGL